MRFLMGAAGSAGTSMTRTVVDFAWENVAGTSIEAGAVPAPGALALLGVAGLASRRRR
jgi:MYXO-CTERM domain-containing protein